MKGSKDIEQTTQWAEKGGLTLTFKLVTWKSIGITVIHLLIEGNPCTKFGIEQLKGSKDIERTTQWVRRRVDSHAVASYDNHRVVSWGLSQNGQGGASSNIYQTDTLFHATVMPILIQTFDSLPLLNNVRCYIFFDFVLSNW